MKKAFTMLELVFVIVVIGILAAAIIPSTKTNPLQEAAVQVVSHIRYTQHLAMVDDKYADDSPTVASPNWYKRRWQIVFEYVTSEPKYTIFSDGSSCDGNANDSETAVDPLNHDKILSGGGTGISNINKINKKLNLNQAYGINSVSFSSNGKFAGSTRLAFDHLGRPLIGKIGSYSSAYINNRLLQGQCQITLFNSESNVTIAVESETGYTHILL
ncbi:MAG: prepilin-type N-terminal cleavage/methylation domain-containing protein [Sulfurimonas sp.]|nr:prepilin-type N-terminal cleavage/methylation domain-containing protein [Sulfurimonas sp.]